MSARAGPRWRVGLTGGIGSGKSTVAALLAREGARVIDADAISRQSTAAGGAAIEAIRQAFGDDAIDAQGALDRDRMRARVFAQPDARARLEAIVHPIVRAQIDAQLAAMDGGWAVLDLPLLAEPGHTDAWRSHLDEVWVVDCEPEEQVRRVMARNGWPREQVQSVLAAQATRAQRLALADAVIDNGQDTTRAALETQVRAKAQALRARFGL